MELPVIFLVDPDVAAAEWVVSHLSAQGWWVSVVPDSDAALRAAAAHAPSLVIVNRRAEPFEGLIEAFGRRGGGPGVILLEPEAEIPAGADAVLELGFAGPELVAVARRLIREPRETGAGAPAPAPRVEPRRGGRAVKFNSRDIFGDMLDAPVGDREHAGVVELTRVPAPLDGRAGGVTARVQFTGNVASSARARSKDSPGRPIASGGVLADLADPVAPVEATGLEISSPAPSTPGTARPDARPEGHQEGLPEAAFEATPEDPAVEPSRHEGPAAAPTETLDASPSAALWFLAESRTEAEVDRDVGAGSAHGDAVSERSSDPADDLAKFQAIVASESVSPREEARSERAAPATARAWQELLAGGGPAGAESSDREDRSSEAVGSANLSSDRATGLEKVLEKEIAPQRPAAESELDDPWSWVDADPDIAYLESTDLDSADLDSTDLDSADLDGADLDSADLDSADLDSADLDSADLDSADLDSADLGGADLGGADLGGADLDGVDVESPERASVESEEAEGESLERESAPELSPPWFEPLIGRPSTGEPSTGEPSTWEPLTGEPLTGEPSIGKPLIGKPLIGETGARELETELETGAFDAVDAGAAEMDSGDPDPGDQDAAQQDAGDLDAGDLDAGDLEIEAAEEAAVEETPAKAELSEGSAKTRRAPSGGWSSSGYSFGDATPAGLSGHPGSHTGSDTSSDPGSDTAWRTGASDAKPGAGGGRDDERWFDSSAAKVALTDPPLPASMLDLRESEGEAELDTVDSVRASAPRSGSTWLWVAAAVLLAIVGGWFLLRARGGDPAPGGAAAGEPAERTGSVDGSESASAPPADASAGVPASPNNGREDAAGDRSETDLETLIDEEFGEREREIRERFEIERRRLQEQLETLRSQRVDDSVGGTADGGTADGGT